MQKLLITQHSSTMADHLQRELREDWHITVCTDSRPVVDLMQYMRPEAMILDLNLSPKDGIAVLEEGQQFLPPAIIATSNYVDDEIIEKLESLGVGALARIPFRAEHIKKLLQDLSEKYPVQQKNIIWHLHALGVNPKLKGYRCLIAAISLIAIDPNMLMKEVYIEVAKLCEIDEVRCVERVIRTAVDKAWKIRVAKIWGDYFPTDKRPSNKEFIVRIAEKI